MPVPRSLSAQSLRLYPAACLLILLTAAASAQPYEPGHAPVTAGRPVELVVWNRPIVTLRARVGETTPAERVERAAERIENIADEELTQPPQALPARVGALEGLMMFVGTRQVFNILQEDVDPESTETLADLGKKTEQRLAEVLAARVAQRSLPLLVRGWASRPWPPCCSCSPSGRSCGSSAGWSRVSQRPPNAAAAPRRGRSATTSR
jgi:hypothetical protein